MEASPYISEAPVGEKTGGKERRHHPRVHCEGFAEAWVTHPESLFRGEILDLSETGCYIGTKARLNLEHLAMVDLRFTVKDRHYRVAARVMDVRQGRGVGLEFLFPEAQTAKWLKNLLAKLNATAETPPKRA